MFHRAIYELIHLARETDEPLDDLRERIMERANRLCDVPADHQPLHAFHCQSAGELLSCIGDFESSAKYLVKAVAELETCVDSIPAITLHDVTKARQEYAVALFRLGNYEESIKVASKLIEQQELYLGPDSPELTDGLETMYMSMCHAADSELARPVYDRIKKLDATHFNSFDTNNTCKVCLVEHAD
jgi:tetratricopeptide (TPR) repeat protein